MAKEYEKFQPSIDIVSTVQAHLAFLKDMEGKSSTIHRSDVVRNAVRRYEKCWLPLLVNKSLTLREKLIMAPPDDVHWVWHVHMLCPLKYIKDCNAIICSVPNHSFLGSKSEREHGRKKARQLWESHYPCEAFDTDHEHIDTSLLRYKSKITYDIVAASERQRVFYYNVSLPHYKLNKFILQAEQRYKKFVNLKKIQPDAFIVPMYDVDLVWHTHQLCPLTYKKDTEAFLGYILTHDDTTTDRTEGSKLSDGDKTTRALWKETYSEDFPIQGVMYRGLSSRNKLANVSTQIMKDLDSKGLLRIEEVKVTGSVKPKLKLSGEIHFNSTKIPLRKIKSGPFVWRNIPKEEFKFSTTVERQLQVCLKRHDLLKSKFVDVLWKSHVFNPVCILKNICKDQNNPKRAEFDMDEEIEDGVTISLACTVVDAEPKSQQYQLIHGMFESNEIPEDDVEFWGPVNLAKLLRGIPNKCSFATHKLRSVSKPRDPLNFSIKVIHSLALRMSVIQIFHKDQMAAISHLIGSEQLPKIDQVNLEDNCPTLDTSKGERAFLIKNSLGDWGVAQGLWTGMQKGKAKKGRKPAKKGNPGYLLAKFYHLNHDRVDTINVMMSTGNTFEKVFRLMDVKVDLESGEIELSDGCQNVAENLALALSVSMLFMLCEPRPVRHHEEKRCTPLSSGKRGNKALKTHKAGDMMIFKALGYHEGIPCNSWLYWSKRDTTWRDTISGSRSRSGSSARHSSIVAVATGGAFLSVGGLGGGGGGQDDDDRESFCPWNPEGLDTDTTTTDEEMNDANFGGDEDDDAGYGDEAAEQEPADNFDPGGYGGCGGCGGGGGGGYGSDLDQDIGGDQGSGGDGGGCGGGDGGGYGSGSD